MPRTIRVGAVIAVVVAVAVVAWLVLKDDNSKKKSQGSSPAEVSAQGLRKAARSWGTPVYWAGEITGRKMELRRTQSGRVFVRYLPKDMLIGAGTPFLTVATYPVGNAYEAVRVAARRNGATSTRIKGGGVLEDRKGGSQRVHFAYPGSGVQVEVFDPKAGEARRLVLDGKVRPVR